MSQVKDPWCCVLEKIRASTEGFDRGALVSYESMRYAVQQLTPAQMLELIDSQIADLKKRLKERDDASGFTALSS